MEQPSAQLAKARPGVPLVAGKRCEALRQTTLPVPCSQPALPIIGAKQSSDSMDKKPKQAWCACTATFSKWRRILCQHVKFLDIHVSQAAKSAFNADKMKKAEQDDVRTCGKFFKVICPAWQELQECMPSCNDISAADWKAVLDAMDRDAMDAGDEAVDLASDAILQV
eukprot:36166-Chlamydomonas_euryale.AAC.1